MKKRYISANDIEYLIERRVVQGKKLGTYHEYVVDFSGTYYKFKLPLEERIIIPGQVEAIEVKPKEALEIDRSSGACRPVIYYETVYDDTDADVE